MKQSSMNYTQVIYNYLNDINVLNDTYTLLIKYFNDTHSPQ